MRAFVAPRSGWRRALEYMGHRIKRLPDSPHRIALGLAAGAFVTFSPYFGFHFFLAAFVAFLIRGNILASLIGTFVGNPITFPFIAAISYPIGLRIMGAERERGVLRKVQNALTEGVQTIWANTKALFGYKPTPWEGLLDTFYSVLLPYTIGGIIPGLITGIAVYFVSKPLVEAYQNRRKGRLMERVREIQAARLEKKAAEKHDNAE
jgi:uncharacterized protein (DUF2062 family)